MNFYILGNMWDRKFLFLGILLTGFLLGCGSNNSDTYVRFQAEGQTYEVKDPTFTVTHMPFNLHFLDLTYPHIRLVPGAMVQWRMKLDSLEQLVGQNLDLNTVDPNKIGPLVLLRLTEDLSAQAQPHSEVQFKIDRIEEGLIEGSFSGTDLKYVSKAKEVTGKIDITARFRAKLIQKTIGR